jgi:hypothetical protein
MSLALPTRLAKGLAVMRSTWRLAASAAAILTFAAAATASADTYTVYSCKGPTGTPNGAAGWEATPATTGVGHVNNACANAGPLSAWIDVDTDPAAPKGSASWTFPAPANTSIVRFAAQRRTTGIAGGPLRLPDDVKYIMSTNSVTLEECSASQSSSCVADLSTPIDKQGLDAAYVRWRVFCTNTGGTCPRPLRADFDTAQIGLKDSLAPTVSGVQTLDSGDTSGILTVGFSAADQGGGVYRAIILVDGKPFVASPLGGGDCTDANPADADPYQFVVPVPCPATVTGAVSRINFRDLPAGPHSVQITVEDAAGNATSVYGPVQFPRLNAENAPSTPSALRRLVNARLRVWFVKTRTRRHTSRYGTRVVTRGRLLDRAGKPVRGARIDVFHRLRSTGHRRLLKTGLKTRADGRITLILPLNVDTRTIEYDYRALRPGPITSRQLLRLTVKRHGRTFIRKLKNQPA